MRKKCCKGCKNGGKCKADPKKVNAWVKVYNQGADAHKIPFRGLGEAKPTPKGAKRKELHARTLTGKMFNYAGPGTAYHLRMKRGDKGITYSDHCAKLHDTWYSRKDATREQIKRADDDFRRCVKAAPNKRFGDSLNKFIMTNVFKGKRMLEKGGLNPLRGTDSKKHQKGLRKS